MVFKEGRFRGEERVLTAPNRAGLEAQVARALAAAPHFDAAGIDVTATADALVLHGFVGQIEEAERAVELARIVAGPHKIENRIRLRDG